MSPPRGPCADFQLSLRISAKSPQKCREQRWKRSPRKGAGGCLGYSSILISIIRITILIPMYAALVLLFQWKGGGRQIFKTPVKPHLTIINLF